MARPDSDPPRAVRLAPVLALGAPVIIGAILLAVVVGSVFWIVVLAGVVVLVAALSVALARATRPAMRPQRVKHAHGWWTSVLGGTSHRPPSSDRPRSHDHG